MRLPTQIHSRQSPDRSAFTLVEMLVSVTLVLLMMTMFASIFQMATGTMSKQKAISEHDQRARSLTTVIRKDLQHRTSRYPFAFYPGEDSANSVTSFSNRSGYFYLSTNDPNSGLDDQLQFTVSANILAEDQDGTPFFGAAVPLVDRRTNGAVSNAFSLAINPNQPETDDGSISPNYVGTSPAAEICYFVRRGNLYRRVLLVREPLAFAGQNLAPQPTSRSGYDYFLGQPNTSDNTTYDGLFQPNGSDITNDFYRLFDYSAYADLTGLQKTAFLGVASLGNESSAPSGSSLGLPQRRFGFNSDFNSVAHGLSREHTVLPNAGFGPPKFLGRPTQAETSTLNFNWPQATSRSEPASPINTAVPDSTQVLQSDMNHDGTPETATNGNPFDVMQSPLQLNPLNGLISAYDGSVNSALVEGRGGLRRMEDLLLANVHEMKIEIWDERLGRFATPGHASLNPATGQAGDFHWARCMNPSYGPLGTLAPPGRVFDTWHPNVDLANDTFFDNPPYIAYRFYPPRVGDTPPGPTPDTAPMPSAEQPNNRGYWQPNTSYSLGDVVFVPWIDVGAPNAFDYTDVEEPKFSIAYQCIVPGTSNAGLESNWPSAAGRKKTEQGGSSVVWQSFDNRRPLKSIRMQIRFYDRDSETMRQVSLIIPMT